MGDSHKGELFFLCTTKLCQAFSSGLEISKSKSTTFFIDSTGYDNEAHSIDNFLCKYESNGYNDGISDIMIEYNLKVTKQTKYTSNGLFIDEFSYTEIE